MLNIMTNYSYFIILNYKQDIADNAKLAIVMNPLATPFKTSIELIVLPIIGIMNTTNAMYSNGI